MAVSCPEHPPCRPSDGASHRADAPPVLLLLLVLIHATTAPAVGDAGVRAENRPYREVLSVAIQPPLLPLPLPRSASSAPLMHGPLGAAVSVLPKLRVLRSLVV